MANLFSCAGCTTLYAPDLDACPHCGSTDYTEDGSAVIARRVPAFVTLTCSGCDRGPWQFRLPVVATGLIELPRLHCASCGDQVQIPWPPKEDAMPKITHSGPTNSRATESSPDVDAGQSLLDGAEPLQEGRPTPAEAEPVAEGDEVTGDGSGEALPEVADYDGMTLAELRDAASARGVATYGSKAQLAQRLREADSEE